MIGKQSFKASSVPTSHFLQRHIGPRSSDVDLMLKNLEYSDLQSFLEAVIPSEIFETTQELSFENGCSELEALEEIFCISRRNKLNRSLIGLGYYGTNMPAVIQRQILENPSWYSAYTPYQAEISQGRLEALFNFQTLITELTGLPIANASLLDEATAVAEAMSMSFVCNKHPEATHFLVDDDVLPQTLALLHTRAEPLGITLDVMEASAFDVNETVFGVFLQLPGKSGRIWDPTELIRGANEVGVLVTVAIDPLAQVLFKPIGQLGADIAVGSTQRFGVPLGFGGPHAAFFATREEFKRQVPGRLVGQSVDSEGNPALRLALQTREQHIRRDKATSNICTSQVLLAVISSFYAIHHGSEGLEEIARKIVRMRLTFEDILLQLGYPLKPIARFDTIEVNCPEAAKIHQLAASAGFNLRVLPIGSSHENACGFGISFDELSTQTELNVLVKLLALAKEKPVPSCRDIDLDECLITEVPLRDSSWLQQPAFNIYRSETELLRYIKHLENKDFSLVNGMIPLGSCTMKLNAAVELLPISWREFASLHPFTASEDTKGYQHIIKQLEKWLAELTGFVGVSLQPNAGSQGEFAGLLLIREWHKSRGEDCRNVCLIPTSAHGTNPASSVMTGMKVIPIACDIEGNIDIDDLESKAKEYSSTLAALMVTYPSTHGVFEPKIREICAIAHRYGGQVYLDGANLNAQLGLCRPGVYGADVCHLNLHKTFCIPHGGGGPGVGPIAVASHLVPFLPGHPLADCGGPRAIGPISAAPWGSAGILPISWMYLRMMGVTGLRNASAMALLSANYIANRLNPYFPILFKGKEGLVAHECILDLRAFKRTAGIEVEDIAKRLMDYGFHAPTVSWPVAGTMMVEPTESESFEELNRFCDAMISIREEIMAIEVGKIDRENNPLKRAPHTLSAVTADVWDRPYSRTQAAFPLSFPSQSKFWPAVARIDNAYGDRHLVCSCSVFEDFVAPERNLNTGLKAL